jgi:hypothetical protein
MAIRTFKEIIDNKGYRISSKDREIFEEGTLQSFFGFSNSDMIEFIMYDINDNQLPQGEFGELVRYIPLNSQNIKDYFLIADGTQLQAFQFPSEYFIDVERLIKEGGYDNGIFKTQITLLNKRVGYESANEKLWIKEISPSRTEVRLLPIMNEVSKKTDLLQRFNIMVTGSDFRDDIIPYVGVFIESINPSEVSGFIRKTYGERWYNNFIAEFGIRGLDSLATTIYNKFRTSMFNEFSNRISNIDDVNYGKEKKVRPSLGFSKEDVYRVAQRILIETIQKYLPNRVIQSSTEVENTFDPSRDELTKILKRRESDVVINPKVPQTNVTKEKKQNVVEKANLNKEIMKEVPKGFPVPKFSSPNPIKSTKRGIGGGTTKTSGNKLMTL